MPTIVQKYGGASLASIEKVSQVAEYIASRRKSVGRIVVVVSAMQGETDRLIQMAREIESEPDQREYDVLVSSGEQVSAALLALALRKCNTPAVSLLGFQVRIVTDTSHGCARIKSIDNKRILRVLDENRVVVVAGFQGVDEHGDLTTLGRGGSDLTAVALAASLNADCCEFYKEVDGVYTADPTICRDAKSIKQISYEEMLELSSMGAKVLQTRSVTLAMARNVPIRVSSSLNPDGKSTYLSEGSKEMEKVIVSGITLNKNEARIALEKVKNKPGTMATIFQRLASDDINVDMIVHNVFPDDSSSLSFTVSRDQVHRATEIMRSLEAELEIGDISSDSKLAKVSAIGYGMRTHSGVAAQMFAALAKEGIRVKSVSTSEIKISCIIEEKYGELALQILHEAFELGKTN